MLLDFLDSCVTLNVWTPPASATFFIVCINHRRLPNVIYICDTHYMLSCPGLISFESQQQHRRHFWDVPWFFFPLTLTKVFFYYYWNLAARLWTLAVMQASSFLLFLSSISFSLGHEDVQLVYLLMRMKHHVVRISICAPESVKATQMKHVGLL